MPEKNHNSKDKQNFTYLVSKRNKSLYTYFFLKLASQAIKRKKH